MFTSRTGKLDQALLQTDGIKYNSNIQENLHLYQLEYISNALKRLQAIDFCLLAFNVVAPPGIYRRQILIGKKVSREERNTRPLHFIRVTTDLFCDVALRTR